MSRDILTDQKSGPDKRSAPHRGKPFGGNGREAASGDRPRGGQSEQKFGQKRSFSDKPYGERSRGDRPYGDKPRGDRPYGDKPRGDRPYRDKPQGDRPYGDKPRGDRPYGDKPRGDRPYGDKPRGDRPYRDKPQGDGPYGDKPRGDRPYGDKPQGDRPYRDKPQGDRPYGDKPRGDRPYRDKPQGDRPYGDKPRGDRPYGDKPRGDRPYRDKPQGDRPYGDRPRGDRPYRDKPQGDRPYRDKPQEARRYGDRDDHHFNPEGGKPVSGARPVAHAILCHVLRDRATLDEAMEESRGLNKLSDRDRRFVRQVATTTLRHHGQMQRLLTDYMETPLPPKSRDVKTLLLMAMTEHFFLRTPSHALVSEAVALARDSKSMQGYAALVNAILRKVTALPPSAVPTPKLNIPRWMSARWKKAYGQDWVDSLADSLLAIPATDLALKPGAPEPSFDYQSLPHGGLRLEAGQGGIDTLADFEAGTWWVQDAAAQIPVRMLQAVVGDLSGKRVLDLCAAPGGKTLQLAAAGAQVTAVDVSAARLERLQANLTRCGLQAEVVCADALEYSNDAPFDIVVLDAPCSATGTLRRHPELLMHRREDSLLSNRRLQAKLLARAAKLLRPGGTLLYAVCSLEPEEGAEQITAALSALPLTPCQTAGLDATRDWLDPLLTPQGYLRTQPQDWGTLGGMDGFFAACLTRQEVAKPKVAKAVPSVESPLPRPKTKLTL